MRLFLPRVRSIVRRRLASGGCTYGQSQAQIADVRGCTKSARLIAVAGGREHGARTGQSRLLPEAVGTIVWSVHLTLASQRHPALVGVAYLDCPYPQLASLRSQPWPKQAVHSPARLVTR